MIGSYFAADFVAAFFGAAFFAAFFGAADLEDLAASISCVLMRLAVASLRFARVLLLLAAVGACAMGLRRVALLVVIWC